MEFKAALTDSLCWFNHLSLPGSLQESKLITPIHAWMRRGTWMGWSQKRRQVSKHSTWLWLFWCQMNCTIRFFFGGGKMCVKSICKEKHLFLHSRWWFQRFFLVSSVWMKLRNTWNWNQLIASSVTIFQAFTYIHLSLVANDFHFPIFQMAWNHQRSRRSYTTFTDLREKPLSPASWPRWDTSSEKNHPDISRCYDFLEKSRKKWWDTYLVIQVRNGRKLWKMFDVGFLFVTRLAACFCRV